MLFDTNIPKIMKKLFDIVDESYNKFDIDKSQDRQTSDFYGYKIKDKHNLNIWVGVDFEIWAKYNYPLIIEITNVSDKQKNKLHKFKSFKDSDGDDRYFFGLDKKYFDNENNIIKKFVDEIYKIQYLINNIEIDSNE